MILIWLIIIPLIGGLAAWILGNRNSALSRWLSLAALALDAVLLISLLVERRSIQLASLTAPG